MSKLIIFLGTLTLSVFTDLPIHLIFGVVFVGIMIELKKIEKKKYPILSNWVLSSVVGWGFGKGLIHFKPEFMKGEVRIFSIMVITLFSYMIVLFLFKNETVQKAFAFIIDATIKKLLP